MTAAELLAELNQLGITIKARGDRLRYSPRSAVTPDLAQRMKAHKPAMLAILAGEPWEPDVSADANEANWQAIDDADRDYLLGPRKWPAPCEWCGGRLIHSAVCNDRRRAWAPNIPFGKYRGRRTDELPRGYIDWVLSRKVGPEGFRDELRRWRKNIADANTRQGA
ncbi:DUF3820 family protein [Pirellulales bacterium]|nr:DUF3820 family protein [Pirellulales bacterium]